MSILFQCKSCQSEISTPDGSRGLGGHCSQCDAPYVVPLRALSPMTAGASRPALEPAPRSMPDLHGKAILLVDDDHFLKVFLRSTLEKSGATVIGARDGESALLLARSQKPDLIFLDLALPGGDGMEVLPRLASCNSEAETPVIVMTASDPAARKAGAMRAGAKAYVRKPVKPAELADALRAALN